MPRLLARAGWLLAFLASGLFAYGVLHRSFPPRLAQGLLTALGLAVGCAVSSLYLRWPPRHPGLRWAGLIFIVASQLAFLGLVWTDWKQEALLWRIWWATAVPSLVAAHLRLLRLLGIEWSTRLGRIAAVATWGHGLSWVLLVLRRDLLADPPPWYIGLMVILGGTSVTCTLLAYARYRKAHAGEPRPYPLWVRWTAFGVSQAVLFLAGIYVGRLTQTGGIGAEELPSAVAGLPREEAEALVSQDAARLKATVAGMEDWSARFPQLRATLEPVLAAENRGYLTAPEDDELRAAYMSFLAYRSALLRLAAVHSGFEALQDPELRARSFLLAYAATTALFNADSRLTETFQDWDLARRKLNEPDPRWGIAAGTFDRIATGVGAEESIERFEEMAVYFEKRAPRWRAAKVWPDAEMRWFESHIRRGVEATRNADLDRHRNWLRRVASRAGSDAYTPVYTVQSQLAVWVGDTRVVTRPPLISQAQIAELRRKLEPGDILLERRNFFLSNAFLPGFWPHSALYVGDETDLAELGLLDHPAVRAKLDDFRQPTADGHRAALIEAVSEGVVFSSVEHSLHADAVAVLRPRATREQKAAAIARAFAHQGKPYDFEFDFFTSDKLVCTEVVYRAYEGIVHFDLLRVAGRDTLPAIEIVRKFARERSSPARQLDFVAFLDGRPSLGRAFWNSEDEFCRSADRPREFYE